MMLRFVNTLTVDRWPLTVDHWPLTIDSDSDTDSKTWCLGDLKNLSQRRRETQRNYSLLITHCSRPIAKTTPNSQHPTPNSQIPSPNPVPKPRPQIPNPVLIFFSKNFLFLKKINPTFVAWHYYAQFIN